MKLQIKREIIIVVAVLIVVVFVSGFALYVFEAEHNAQVNSYWDGVWLAAATASSVGYGDVYPVSPEGKVLSSLLGFTGLLLIGVTSALFTRFLLGYTKKS